VVLPSAVTAWLTGRHRAVPPAPVFDDDCATEPSSAPPVMVTPGEGQVVTLIPGVPAAHQLVPLTASTHAAVGIARVPPSRPHAGAYMVHRSPDS